MGIKSEAIGKYYVMGEMVQELAADIEKNANHYQILYNHDIDLDKITTLANMIKENAEKLAYITSRIAGSAAVNIIVNGQSFEVLHEIPRGEGISYSEIFSLAYPGQPERTCSATYRNGRDNKSGILSQGQSVELVDGMIFNIAETGNA